MGALLAFTTPGHSSLALMLVVLLFGFAQSNARSTRQKGMFGFLGLTVLAHNFPDLDSLTYLVGITSESIWGHRGFLHSYVVGAIAGVGIALVAARASGVRRNQRQFWFLIIWFVAGTWLHTLTDMLCDCDQRVAWAWPFSEDRQLFRYRTIPRFTFDVRDLSFLSAFFVELRLIALYLAFPFGTVIVGMRAREVWRRRYVNWTFGRKKIARTV